MSLHGVRSFPRIGAKPFSKHTIFVQRLATKSFSIGRPEAQRRRAWPWYIASIFVGYGGRVLYDSYTADDKNDGLNSHTFTRYVLRGKDAITTTSAIFTLSSVEPSKGAAVEEAWQKGIWSVEFKQPQLQIARAYTPLPPSVETVAGNREDLRFLIRKDPEGEVSTYLHQLPNDSSIEVRGPQIEFLIPEDTSKILFLAGGTGIAPALQAAYCLLETKEIVEGRQIHILWANRRREDCLGGLNDNQRGTQPWWRYLPLFGASERSKTSAQDTEPKNIIVKDLDALKARHPERFQVDYFVDEEGSFITDSVLAPLIQAKVADACVIVSGPDGFVSYLAGPKNLSNGAQDQDPVGGILQRLGLGSKSVWKL